MKNYDNPNRLGAGGITTIALLLVMVTLETTTLFFWEPVPAAGTATESTSEYVPLADPRGAG